MKRIANLSSSWFPLVLLGLCALAFGRWALTLGYFWDDFPIRWILHEYGIPGLQQYFSIDRPFMARIYQVTTALIQFTPLSAHVFALISRVISGAALWTLLRLVWPKQKDLAGWSALLFVVYPGFGQQYVAIVYGHFYLLIAAFLGSVSLTILAVRHPKRFWPLTVAALLLSAVNLFCWEYYFLLDLLRPWLVLWVLGEQNLAWKTRLRRSFVIWLPYLLVFLGAIYWRSSILGYQTYQPVFFTELRNSPLTALLHLGLRIMSDIGEAGFLPWWKAVTTLAFGLKDIRYLLVVLGSAVMAAVFFGLQQAGQRARARVSAQVFVTAWVALLVAGAPFWLIDHDINLYFSNDRFVLPFMLGGSLLAAALLGLLPRRAHILLLALLVGLSAGVQYHNGYAYRADWDWVRRLFWQITWRMPGLEPHTTLLLNDNAFTYYTDISLSAPLNWIYQPVPGGKMEYMLLYPALRVGGKIPSLDADQTISVDYRSGVFKGSTSQVVVMTYLPPGCLRVLDPEIEAENTAVQDALRRAMPLSDERWILPAATGRIPEDIFGPPPVGTWCETFERADLARQMQDWSAVIQLWKDAQTAGLGPQDGVELLPFIEGLAHSGDWKGALDLSHEAVQPGSQVPGMLCRIWTRIDRETDAGSERDEAIRRARADFGCQ